MKIQNLLFAFLLITAELSAQPVMEWQHVLGGSNIDVGHDGQPTPDGGYMITGTSISPELPGAHGGFDWVITKINQHGFIQKQRLLGGGNEELHPRIKATSDGGYFIMGSTFSSDGDVVGHHDLLDGWAVKLNDTLGIDWQKCIGGSQYDNFNNIIITNDGGYVISGGVKSTDGDILINYGDSDFFIIKLKGNGTVQWKRSFGGTAYDQSSWTSQTADEGYILAGISRSSDGQVGENHGDLDIWIIKLNSSGNIQWKKVLGGSQREELQQVIQTDDGGYLVAGSTRSNDQDVSGNHGLGDIWIVKLNANGALEWQKTVGGSANETPIAIHPTSGDAFIISALTSSSDGDVSNYKGYQDFWLIKMDNQGNILWEKTYGGTNTEYIANYYPTPNGGFIFTGSSKSSDGDLTINKGSQDAWVLKVTDSGEIDWSLSFGGNMDETIYNVIPSADGGYGLIGGTRSTNGDVAGLQHGEADIWFIKLSPDLVPTNDPGMTIATQGLEVFPNPADNQIRLQLPTTSSLLKVQITSTCGKVFVQKTIPNGGNIIIHELPSGVYIGTVHDESGKIYSQKFVVQH